MCTVTSQNGCISLNGVFTLGASCSAITDVVFGPLSLSIPDSNPTGSTNVQNVSGLGGNIVDLDVDVAINHSWFGDLIVQVEHLGTIVTIVDRPGVPVLSTVGCPANNPDIVLDDEGTGGNVEDLCSAANDSTLPVPPSPPNYVPNNPLSAFDGLSPNGDWTITVSDNAGIDTGTLIRWSLHISTDDIICPVGGCTCRGDVNGDTVVNGKDIRNFAACLVSGGAGCTCADVNNSGAANPADIPAFITAVLNGACAP